MAKKNNADRMTAKGPWPAEPISRAFPPAARRSFYIEINIQAQDQQRAERPIDSLEPGRKVGPLGQGQIAVEIGQQKDFELDDVVKNQITEEIAQARIGETPRFLMEIEDGPGPDQQDDDQGQDVVMFQEKSSFPYRSGIIFQSPQAGKAAPGIENRDDPGNSCGFPMFFPVFLPYDSVTMTI